MLSTLSTIPFITLVIILLCPTYLLLTIGFWRVFEKAGRPGWAAIIPIYNTVVLLQIIGKPIWWVVILYLVPVVYIVLYYFVYDALAQRFGRDSLFSFGLWLAPFIFLLILGFDSSEYDESAC